MNKTITKLLLTALPFFAAADIYAEDILVDGIYYNLNSTEKTAEVTSGKNRYSQKEVIIPEQVTSGGITYSVTKIGDEAFSNCNSIKSVTMPNSITSIGNAAFYCCGWLKTVNMSDAITEIGDRAFYEDTEITSISIPKTVSHIGSAAFQSCNGLTEVHITDLAAWCGIEFLDVTSNPLLSSRYDTNFYLYLNGEKVTDLVIPESVTSIGNDAFPCYRNLKSVTIPKSVTSIGEGAFYQCLGLTSIHIPESVISIGACAFMYCSELTSISISSTVTNIGTSAFYGCMKLNEISCHSDIPPVCGDYDSPYMFTSTIYSTATLNVPLGAKEAYSQAAEWENFLNIKEVDFAAGINDITTDNNLEIKECYTIDGRKLAEPQRGINIVRFSNGETKKVYIK